jgi:hypothetical protein
MQPLQRLFIFKTVKVQKKKVGNEFDYDGKYAESKYRQTGKTLLDQNVHRIVEVLVITQTNRLPNRERFLQLVECCGNESITSIMRKVKMQKLSEGIFRNPQFKKTNRCRSQL